MIRIVSKLGPFWTAVGLGVLMAVLATGLTWLSLLWFPPVK